ncbi:hypothetical protein B0H13DRAFT_1979748 [Mycena leptocephala]|nr:hypothetical protein B0H13DRAFT_1979748 [Mycena leptocephala]
MISSFKYLATALAALALVGAVVPGPGLPSLESLGLTSADLYKTVPTTAERSIEARFPLMCGQVPPACKVADAVACYNFLKALGTKACTVTGDNTAFCHAGGCNWVGSSLSGTGSDSSFCRDVAAGGKKVIDSCQGNGFVDGSNAAGGNGFLAVTISGRNL